MTAFQIFLTGCGVVLLLATLVGAARQTISRRIALLWCLVWGAMIVAVLDPSRLTRLARFVGIGRGADLLLYIAVVVMLVGFVMIYARLHRLRRDVTLLVRELAVRGAREGEAGETVAKDESGD